TLMRQITSSTLHPTIEGDNGVGKSSLVAVAGYRLRRDYEDGKTSQAIIPMATSFQLSASDTAPEFRARVMYAVAQAFITNHASLKAGGLAVPDVSSVDAWLNRPTFTQSGGGVTFAGFG